MENFKSVFPQSNSVTNLSCQDFQEILTSWFHDNGVLTELRLQLRFKLIGLLRNTMIGREISNKKIQSTSLYNQAVNLIVAEYLLQNKCHYSLSIFNTEATFSSILSECPTRFSEELNQKRLYSSHFDRESVLQILDQIGLTKADPYYDELLNLYYNSQENQTILCSLITLICQFPKVNIRIKDEKQYQNLDSQHKDNDNEIQKIEEFLTDTNLSHHCVKKTGHDISLVNEMKGKQQKKKLLAVIDQLKNEITFKDKKIKKILKSKNVLQTQLLKVNKNHEKEPHLENLLNNGNLFNDIILWQNNEKNLPEVKRREMKINFISQMGNEENKTCQLSHCSDVCRGNIKLTQDLKSEIVILKKEKKEQKELLQKFFLIYKDLLNKFNNCQNKLTLLNSRVNEGFREESFNSLLHAEKSNLQGELHEKDDSEVSSDIVMEEILYQARVKLQKLEDETKEIQDKFKYIHYV